MKLRNGCNLFHHQNGESITEVGKQIPSHIHTTFNTVCQTSSSPFSTAITRSNSINRRGSRARTMNSTIWSYLHYRNQLKQVQAHKDTMKRLDLSKQ
ncbi:hypothetical protein NC651_030709 [Populus alba x Populus x berolinensis]|nr:hypothetical protein NC651_030709 [Populus alba x Populus x berolinensis]